MKSSLLIKFKEGCVEIMKTRLTELLNIEYPILQGAMAWISDSKLAAAVSNAGGAGIIGAGGRNGEWVRAEIQSAKKITDKPFGVNISLESTRSKEDIIKAVIEEHVDFVTIGAGDPIPYIDRFHMAGIKVIGIIPNCRLAKKVEEAGIDMIIIEGMEGGGRIGNLTTMALMENIIPEVNIPIVVAGGIVDGSGLAAALIMGADGVQMGSRFLLSEECAVHPSYKQSIIDATDVDNITIGLSRGLGMRGIRSAYSNEYATLENSGVENSVLQGLTRGISRKVAECGLGEDGRNGIVQVGQSLNRLNEIMTVNQIISKTMSEAKDALLLASKYIE